MKETIRYLQIRQCMKNKKAKCEKAKILKKIVYMQCELLIKYLPTHQGIEPWSEA